jgi:hypothetical protein
MLRLMAVFASVLTGAVEISAGDEPKGNPSTLVAETAPEMMPDLSWRPAVGDRVTVHLPDSPALRDRATCEKYIRASNAGDADGIRELVDRKLVDRVEVGTPVLVIEPHGLPRTDTTSYSGLSADQVHSSMQDAIFRAASRPRPIVSIEGRILDGPLRGTIRFIPMGSLAKLIPKPTPYVQPVKPTPKPVDPATRAATLLQAARNLDKAGKSKAAQDSYRRIAKDFPETTSAKFATARLKELGVN